MPQTASFSRGAAGETEPETGRSGPKCAQNAADRGLSLGRGGGPALALRGGVPGTGRSGVPRNPAPADPRKPAPSGDVGLRLESEQCQTPPVCFVTLLYTGGRLLRYDSGNPLPHTVYELAGGTFGPDGSFATSGADTQDPSETASVSGRIVDLDADNVADQVEATVTFPDGPQALTLVDYPDIDGEDGSRVAAASGRMLPSPDRPPRSAAVSTTTEVRGVR